MALRRRHEFQATMAVDLVVPTLESNDPLTGFLKAVDGEVRLAMILNTDSNFDRRAFRSAVRGIGQLADRYLQELERLARGSSDE